MPAKGHTSKIISAGYQPVLPVNREPCAWLCATFLVRVLKFLKKNVIHEYSIISIPIPLSPQSPLYPFQPQTLSLVLLHVHICTHVCATY